MRRAATIRRLNNAKLAFVLAALAALLAPAAVAHAVPNPRPFTVPAVREWSGGEGTFLLGRRARVVADRALRDEARTLARDLRLPYTARAGTRPRRGDIVLRRGRAPGGGEGYVLRLGSVATVTASATAGAYYGGRTLLQLLSDNLPTPRGVARDWPRYPERGLMVDNGRKFFTPGWLEARVRELGALKLNLLHLHFSDNQGFRIRSDKHPEVVTEPALSKADVRRLLRIAARHHVTVVPEIDVPGHLRAALRAHPELQLVDADGNRHPDKLDVTLPAARTFVGDLVDEFLPLFPGPWWHSGGDEYLGVNVSASEYDRYPALAARGGADAVLAFLEDVGDRVRRAGKDLRVWSDAFNGARDGRLDPRTVVEWWENGTSPDPRALLARGHSLLNASFWPTYVVSGGPAAGAASIVSMFDEWEVNQFDGLYTSRWDGAGGAPVVLAPGDRRVRGAKLHAWTDDPAAATEQQIGAAIAPRLRVLAQKTWASPPLSPRYADFQPLSVVVAP